MSESPSFENIDGLINQIQTEGLQRGQAEAERILEAAREQAKVILAEAQHQAEERLRLTEERIRKNEQAARQAAEQVGRDLVLTVRQELEKLLTHLIEQECQQRLSAEALQNLLLRVAEAFVQQHDQVREHGLEVLLSKSDRAALGEEFVARLREQIKAGVQIGVNPRLQHGFHLGLKGDPMRWDFSDQALAEALASLLLPRFARLFQDESKP